MMLAAIQIAFIVAGVMRVCMRLLPDAETHHHTSATVPYAVGLYITSAYWFTSSTSFANPAVTIARSLSDTFAGIAPTGTIAFVAQFIGMLAAVILGRWLCRT
jgi:glycerol uptake facilitator-like aquaporin